jgi:HK97 family phage major capsid protein
MKSIAEQIAAFEAKRAATAARMSEIMDKSAEAGSTLDESQIQEYDGLAAELKAVDEHIVRLKAHEAKIVARAAAITLTVAADPAAASVARAGTGIFSVGARLEPGQKMARFALALKRARGNLNDALSICQNNRGWMDTSPEVAMVLKAAVAAGDTTTPGWASELVYAQNLANEFIEFLRPLTIIGKITNFRRVPFNVRMGSQTAGSTGYWVGQGLPVPVSKLTTSSQTLGMAKAAGLVSIDDELVRSSSPSAELMVRDDLAAAVTQLLDVSFIDPNLGAVVNVSPASVLQGVTPITPSGTDYAALKTDVKALFAPVIAANLGIEGGVFVMTHTTALALSLMQNALGQDQFPGININGGTWFGLPVITSQYALIPGSPQFGNIIALVFPREIFLADDGQITISISNEASIQMLDNPTNQSTGGTVATTMVSMFQTNSEAIKAVRYLNWAKRRPQAAQFIQAAAYS